MRTKWRRDVGQRVCPPVTPPPRNKLRRVRPARNNNTSTRSVCFRRIHYNKLSSLTKNVITIIIEKKKKRLSTRVPDRSVNPTELIIFDRRAKSNGK